MLDQLNKTLDKYSLPYLLLCQTPTGEDMFRASGFSPEELGLVVNLLVANPEYIPHLQQCIYIAEDIQEEGVENKEARV